MTQLAKIFSLEDNDTDFMTLQFALRAAGVDNPIERYEDGGSAMQTLLGADSNALVSAAALILLDLNLPGVDGLQILKALRARDPDRKVPIVILSTSSHPRDIDACHLAGADAYLVKPFEIEDWETKVGGAALLWLRPRRTEIDCSDVASSRDTKFEFDGFTRPISYPSNAAERRRADLTKAIEGEIIPRLLLMHGASGTACPPKVSVGRGNIRAPKMNDEVAELAQLVLARDTAVAASFVETMRVQGATIETVFQVLVAPAARLLGDLWQADLCSFTEFSDALSCLQSMLAELKPLPEKGTIH